MTKPWVLQQIIADAHARRELLWLRAQEKEDAAMARELEEIDPGLLGRLRASGLDCSEKPDEHQYERRERFGQLFDECFHRHELALAVRDEGRQAAKLTRASASLPSRRTR